MCAALDHDASRPVRRLPLLPARRVRIFGLIVLCWVIGFWPSWKTIRKAWGTMNRDARRRSKEDL